MKKILVAGLLLIGSIVHSQVLQLYGDTIKVKARGGGHAEFVVQNSTSGVNGFMYNAGNGKTVFVSKVVNTMSDLNTIALSPAESPLLQAEYLVKGYYNANDGAGGRFILIDTVGASAVPGMVIPVGSTKAYVRDVSNARALNIKWFGAIGGGITTYKQDSAAITDAISFCSKLKSSSLYFPGTKEYYGFNGNGIDLPSNIEIFGDGVNSVIKHVNPAGGSWGKLLGTIFFTASYGAATRDGILKPGMANYPIFDAALHQKYIRLQNIADTVHFPVGKFFGLGARIFGKGNTPDTNKLRYSQFEMNRVNQIHGDTIFLKYYLSTALQADSFPAVIIDLNSGLTINKWTDKADFATENVHIHDLTLSQANRNLITDSAYSAERLPFNTIGQGCTFESVFENLHLDDYGTFGGNLFNRCEIRNLTISSGKKMFDFGYCSANTNVHDVWWDYNSLINDTTTKSLIFLDDGTHDMNLYNLYATGAYDGNDLILFGAPVYNIKLSNSHFDFPKYDGEDQTAIKMTDKDIWTVHDIDIDNVVFNLKKPGEYIRVIGIDPFQNRNIRLSNLKFYSAETPYSTLRSVQFYNAGNVHMRNAYFSGGDTMTVNNCDSSLFENVTGNMFLRVVTGADSTYFINSTFKNQMGSYVLNGLNTGKMKSFNVPYAVGNDTWLDGTPPDSTRTAAYSWVKDELGLVTVNLNIFYAKQGTSNLNVDLVFPADLPKPLEPQGFAANNNNMYLGLAKLNQTPSNESGSSGVVMLKKDGVGYKFRVSMAATNTKALQFTIQYFSKY